MEEKQGRVRLVKKVNSSDSLEKGDFYEILNGIKPFHEEAHIFAQAENVAKREFICWDVYYHITRVIMYEFYKKNEKLRQKLKY